MNKNILKSLIISILLIILTACEKTDFEIAQEMIIEKMGWIYDANPDDDFYEAIENKDFRFKGIYGVTLYTPSVSIECLNYEKDISPIDGASDARTDYEHEKLIAIAVAYAKRYNLRMLMYLEEHKNFQCNS